MTHNLLSITGYRHSTYVAINHYTANSASCLNHPSSVDIFINIITPFSFRPSILPAQRQQGHVCACINPSFSRSQKPHEILHPSCLVLFVVDLCTYIGHLPIKPNRQPLERYTACLRRMFISRHRLQTESPSPFVTSCGAHILSTRASARCVPRLFQVSSFFSPCFSLRAYPRKHFQWWSPAIFWWINKNNHLDLFTCIAIKCEPFIIC